MSDLIEHDNERISQIVARLTIGASSVDASTQSSTCTPAVADTSCQTKRILKLSVASQCDTNRNLVRTAAEGAGLKNNSLLPKAASAMLN